MGDENDDLINNHRDCQADDGSHQSNLERLTGRPRLELLLSTQPVLSITSAKVKCISRGLPLFPLWFYFRIAGTWKKE